MGALGLREGVKDLETGRSRWSVAGAWTAAGSGRKVPWRWGAGGWWEDPGCLWESCKWEETTGKCDHMNGHGLSQRAHAGGRSGQQEGSLVQASDVDS